MIPGLTTRRRFSDLSEQEVLALAISSEEDDARIYRSYAQRLRADYPSSAALFDGMALEEDEHRQRLIALHQDRFGEVIPLIRREHVAGYYARRPVWLVENLSLDTIRGEAEAMEHQAEAFYLLAAKTSKDAATRKLLGDLAAAEAGHQRTAVDLQDTASARRRQGRRRPRRTSPVHSDMGAAGLGGVDGWVGFNPCAHLRHRLRDAGHLDHVSCRHGGIGGCGHFDGLYRSGA